MIVLYYKTNTLSETINFRNTNEILLNVHRLSVFRNQVKYQIDIISRLFPGNFIMRHEQNEIFPNAKIKLAKY